MRPLTSLPLPLRLAAWLLLLLMGPAPAAAHHLPAPVNAALSQAGIPDAGVALYVQDTAAAAPLLAWNADAVMNPASTMKLVTTLAGLELLGPAYAWSTEVYADGPRAGGVLKGNLIIKGYGDPRLTLERFWLLLRSVKQRGIHTIRGDVILDRSYFSAPADDPGAFDGEPYRPYNVGPDALLVNFNAVRVHFVPDPAAGKVRVYAEPHPPGLRIGNRLTLSGDPCRDWQGRHAAQVQTDWSAARIDFAGPYPVDCGEKGENFSVLGSTRFAGELFRQLWRELGGRITGTVRDGTLPPDARLIASVESPPLAQIVRDINKFSNNVMARQLFLTLGAWGFGPPATPDSATRAIHDWLLQNRLAFPELVVENGSGLSRVERISARHLGQLLVRAYSGPMMPEFMASLPVAGVDGTLKRHMKNSSASGQAHLKTGYLEGVRAIAGYVLDSRGRRMAVVLFINHANAGNARAVQDAVVQWVYQEGVPQPEGDLLRGAGAERCCARERR